MGLRRIVQLVLLVFSLTNQASAAISFDGVDDYILGKNAIIIANQANATVAGWFYTTGTSAGPGDAIYCERGTGNDVWKINIPSDGNLGLGDRIQFIHRDDAGTLSTIGSNTDITYSAWNHFAMVKNGSTVTFYLNGVSDGSGTLDGNDTLTNSDIDSRIGGDQADISADFVGRIEEFAIFNKVLSSSEIAQLYGNGSPPKGIPNGISRATLKAYWPMDEFRVSVTASGSSTIRDYSESGNHGTPQNSPSGIAGTLIYRSTRY